MDTETRVRTDYLMGMYVEDETHYNKTMGPIKLVAVLLKTSLQSVALSFTPEQAMGWDFKTDIPKIAT